MVAVGELQVAGLKLTLYQGDSEGKNQLLFDMIQKMMILSENLNVEVVKGAPLKKLKNVVKFEKILQLLALL